MFRFSVKWVFQGAKIGIISEVANTFCKKLTLRRAFLVFLSQYTLVFPFFLRTFAPAFEAQMAESVDALVSNTSGATRPGSTPGLGTSLKSKSAANQTIAALFLCLGCTNDVTFSWLFWQHRGSSPSSEGSLRYTFPCRDRLQVRRLLLS